jgi:hypothetical protein
MDAPSISRGLQFEQFGITAGMHNQILMLSIRFDRKLVIPARSIAWRTMSQHGNFRARGSLRRGRSALAMEE